VPCIRPDARWRVLLRGRPPLVRAAALTEQLGPDECWPWLGRMTDDGYPVLGSGGKTLSVHVLVLERELGRQLAGGECALHHCDHPWCTNPLHLFHGTRADNNADMVAKGRQSRGERQPSSKLTEADVIAIRAGHSAGRTCISLGIEYGVSNSLVCRIVAGKKWRHIPFPSAALLDPPRAEHAAPPAQPPCGVVSESSSTEAP
jgi:hypothetical protein